MPLAKASNVERTEYKPVPEGRYTAICYQIIDIGTQMVTWKGESKPSMKVIFAFELRGQDSQGEPTILMDDGRPFSIRQTFTANLGSKANLRPWLGSWRGKPITEEESKDAAAIIKSFLGKPCEIVVAHEEWKDGSGKVSEKIASISPPHPKTTIPPRVNPLVFFDMGEWDNEVFNNLSSYIKGKIEQSLEFKEKDSFKSNVLPPKADTAQMTPVNSNGLPADDFEDDIPW